MKQDNIWYKSKGISIQTVDDIKCGFDIGFDDEVPEETRNELRKLVSWVECNFNMPITLWVDFEYKHYLVGDMLAVVLTTKYRTCAVTIPKYYIYVINVKTGRKVNLDEILEYKNINKDDFNEKVKNGIINSYYSSFDDSKYYDYLIDENLKTYENDTNKKFFIYDNGNINLLISITIHPVKIEEIFKIITIE